MRLRVHSYSLVLTVGLWVPGALLLGCSAQSGPVPEQTAQANQAVERSDTSAQPVSTIGSSIMEAARIGLPSFLSSIAEGDEASFGFKDRSEFAEIAFGEPYEWFMLDDDVTPKAANSWSVPLLVKGKAVCLLKIRQVGTSYKAVGIGAALFAEELGKIETARKANDSKRPITRRSILRSWNEKADFVVYDAHPTEPAERGNVRAVFTQSAHLALDARVEKKAAHEPRLAAAVRNRTGFDLDQLATLMRK